MSTMSSAWNWAGILLWLILIAYLLWVIENVHSRKKRGVKLVSNPKKSNLIFDLTSRNFKITLVEVVVLLLFGFGLGKTTFDHHLNRMNSMVVTKCEPLDLTEIKPNKKHPNAKARSYYVQVDRSKSRSFSQKYHFSVAGRKIKSASKTSFITAQPNQLAGNLNLPARVSNILKMKAKKEDRLNHRTWVIRFVTAYRNTFGNGIGLHAGQKKFYYTIIRIPNNSKRSVYVHYHHKKAQKA